MTGLHELIRLLSFASKAEGSSSPADPYGEIKKANAELRATAKWIVTSFGAVGAILLSGIQFSNLGKLTADVSDSRVVAAIVGVALGALGVSNAIWFTSAVLAPTVNSFRSIEKHEKVVRRVLDDRELVGLNYQELKDGIAEADRALLEAREVNQRDAAHAERMKWEESKRAALFVIGTEILAERYRRARRAVVFGVALAAVGLGLFAWGANPPDGEKPPTPAVAVVLGQAPVLVDVHLTRTGVRGLAKSRGCSRSDFKALIIGPKRELVTVPTPTCKSVRFVLTTDLGLAVAAG